MEGLFAAARRRDLPYIRKYLDSSNVNARDEDGNPWLVVYVSSALTEDDDVDLLAHAMAICVTETLSHKALRQTIRCQGWNLLDIAAHWMNWRFVKVLHRYFQPAAWKTALSRTNAQFTGSILLGALIGSRGDDEELVLPEESALIRSWNANEETFVAMCRGMADIAPYCDRPACTQDHAHASAPLVADL
jgi:hypothetical protein